MLRAYAVTLRVLLSYLLLKIAALFHGSDWLRTRRPEIHRRNARRVVRMVLTLKGLFIKVGQLVSILTNFLPDVFRRELEELQDRIPPHPVGEITERIGQELGHDVSELYASFDPIPMASASLAQVHEARLHDGRRVAVKVQHVDIEEVARIDLKTIRRLLGFAAAVAGIRGLARQYEQVESVIHEELDFAQEARNIEDVAANFEDVPDVGFPEVIHDRSTRRVLTTTYVVGAKVTDLEALDAMGVDRTALAERIVAAYCRMIFRDGLYHADPHPGNLIVRPDGVLVFIDFGAVARLSPEMKEGILQFLLSLLKRDEEGILKAFRQMGFVAQDGHEKTIRNLVDYFQSRFLSDMDLEAWSLEDVNADSMMAAKLDTLGDFRKLDISFRDLTNAFQVPRDWILLERTVLLLMGLCTHLDPGMNPVRTMRPYLEEAVLGPEKTWGGVLGSAVKDVALSLVALPDELRRVLAMASRGEFEFRVRGLEEGVDRIYALGHQFIYGLIASCTGTLAYVTHLNGDARAAFILAIISGFFTICIGVSMLRARKR